MDENSLTAESKVTARDLEADMLWRCVAAARGSGKAANDQREANVFRLASIVVDKRFPIEALRLKNASDAYFWSHPKEKLLADEVVRRGWVWGLPRLRDMLSLELARG